MESLKADVQCSTCEKSFSVDLNKMRLNYQHTCPFCGAPYRVSEKEAIRAHRALDGIEHMRKCACCVSGRDAALTVSAQLMKRLSSSAVIGNDLCEVA